ncbi:MAG: ABC transporter permease [Myxococcaceae bacterium]|nr:ABC transporter permease [Myxococcaceae bacterium]
MNTIGVRTLLVKEVRRFMRVPGQTVLSPLISTSLYFLVFGYTLGGRQAEVDGVPYVAYIVPGLVFLGLANNAFLNSSSSLFITKIQGTIVDLLAAPLGATELLVGFIAGAMTRGLLVGLLTWLVALVFTGVQLAHPALTFGFLFLTAWVFSVLGLLAGLWADKFEQINFFPTFLMLPLTFLGGVFYSVHRLPEPFRTASLFNPVVYMVEGLRAGMLDKSDVSPLLGLSLLLGLAVSATATAWVLLARGYKIRN